MTGAAMVTGASSGIGRVYADALGGLGMDLVLVARREERLRDCARELAARHGVRTEVMVADLADAGDRGRVAERAAAGLAMLVNNAGFGSFAAFADLEPAVARQLVDVHVLAPLEVARAAVPAMVAAGTGTIVNLASGLAFSGTLPRAEHRRRITIVYAGVKAFVVTFSRALAQELDGTGVRVQALCPSATATEFHGDSSPLGAMRAEDVVAASLHGLRSGEVLCLPGLDDPELVDRLGALERELLAGNAGPELASRYREERVT
jgi:short-subunit dehydrogenase